MSDPEHQDPGERELASLMRTLDPTPEAEQRMEAALFRALDAPPRTEPAVPELSLTAEWLELLRVRPAANSALVMAAAVVLYVMTPLGALAGLLAH